MVHKVDRSIWYDEVIKRTADAAKKGFQICLVGGLRFPSDGDAIRKAGGCVIKIYRPGFLSNDLLDPTERERETIQKDSLIISNGGIDDVERCAKKILDDITSGRLQAQYIATQC